MTAIASTLAWPEGCLVVVVQGNSRRMSLSFSASCFRLLPERFWLKLQLDGIHAEPHKPRGTHKHFHFTSQLLTGVGTKHGPFHV
jgi:hypothetical protein